MALNGYFIYRRDQNESTKTACGRPTGRKRKKDLRLHFSFAGHAKGKMAASILCAVISVAGGLLPYLGVYRIILIFFDGDPSMEQILPWIALCAGGYVVKQLFHGISTSLSHISAYRILENIRLALAEKLMRAPLGYVLSNTAGNLKSVIVDRVETIELPLAHMIPEGISNLLLPVCVFAYLLVMNWKIALAALICVPVGAAVYAVMMRNYSSQYDKYMKSSAHVNSVIIEYTEGIQVIKAFNQSTDSYQKYADSVKDFKEFTLDWFRSTWGLMTWGSGRSCRAPCSASSRRGSCCMDRAADPCRSDTRHHPVHEYHRAGELVQQRGQRL